MKKTPTLSPTVEPERGIPLPKETRGARPGARTVYPWATMRVGESFPLRPSPTGAPVQVGSYVANANRKYAPRVFTARVTKDGARIWRVK